MSKIQSYSPIISMVKKVYYYINSTSEFKRN